MPIPITIITGYLGAGKTTLLRRIIDETDKRIAILMNEFGEIAIDSKIIKGKNIEYAELAGGCVCCSLSGEFEAAVKEIVEKINPEMIVVETTGVAEPDALVLSIEENLPEVKLDAVITVVDADSMIRFPSLGVTGRLQIEIADVILLNKIDLVSEAQLKEVEQKIRELNNRAIIFQTKFCNVDTDLLFGLGVEHHIKMHGQHVLDVDYFAYTTKNFFVQDKFEEFLKNLPAEIYRAKGFVKFSKGSFLFNFVAGRWDLEKWEDVKRSELVFIGKGILKLKDKIISQLKAVEQR
jgi:G3E family GTPase